MGTKARGLKLTPDNPACVNPDHLWVGTQKQNMRDREKKGRANRKPPSPKPKNPYWLDDYLHSIGAATVPEHVPKTCSEPVDTELLHLAFPGEFL